MSYSKADLPHVKWGLLTFLLVLVVGGVIIVASENFIAQSQLEQRNAKRQLDDARRQLTTAREDNENMKSYTMEYDALLKRNIIGSDQRLDWMEGLEKIHKQDRVPGFMEFKYAIAPQKPYVPAPPLDGGNFEPNLSGMTLQVDMLHEEQLIDFFSTLRTGINGWFLIDRCAMERTSAAADADDFGVAHKLKAECSGGWLTLKNRNAK